MLFSSQSCSLTILILHMFLLILSLKQVPSLLESSCICWAALETLVDNLGMSSSSISGHKVNTHTSSFFSLRRVGRRPLMYSLRWFHLPLVWIGSLDGAYSNHGEVKPTWRIYQGVSYQLSSPQTEEATWMNSETFQPNRKEVQLPWLNF